MKKIVFACLAVLLVSSLSVFAAGKGTVKSAADLSVIKGTIIDNKCADANKDTLDSFIQTHPKSCTLLPGCAASGYSIYVDEKLLKFDKASNAKIEKFLKKKTSKLAVEVSVKKVGEELNLVSIKNQK